MWLSRVPRESGLLAGMSDGAMASTTGQTGLRLTVPIPAHGADISRAEQGLPLQELPTMESSPLLKEATRIGDDGEDTQSSQSDNQGPFTPSSEEASSTTEGE